MEEFAIGTLVQLKSGGPVMTVEKVCEAPDGDLRAWCQWFGKGDKPSSEKFRPEMLKEYKPEDEGPIEPQF